MIFSDSELQKPVEVSLEKVRPYLIRDGGNLKLVKIDNGCVYIQLQGACKGCPSSTITLKNKIEHQLKMDIHPDISVVRVEND
ncbi:NifU family protein [Helicobacter pametensis]|uniref:NifU family protein n=1 Tax=Helicobacter pametensis TaxID=95149 RepID=UPI0004AE5283|nr:NifU family protein [Helicobacter pametensis]